MWCLTHTKCPHVSQWALMYMEAAIDWPSNSNFPTILPLLLGTALVSEIENCSGPTSLSSCQIPIKVRMLHDSSARTKWHKLAKSGLEPPRGWGLGVGGGAAHEPGLALRPATLLQVLLFVSRFCKSEHFAITANMAFYMCLCAWLGEGPAGVLWSGPGPGEGPRASRRYAGRPPSRLLPGPQVVKHGTQDKGRNGSRSL